MQIIACVCYAPSHYLNHCWFIVNWNITNKFQWNSNRNSNIFIQEKAFQNVVCQSGGHLVPASMRLINFYLQQHGVQYRIQSPPKESIGWKRMNFVKTSTEYLLPQDVIKTKTNLFDTMIWKRFPHHMFLKRNRRSCCKNRSSCRRFAMPP